MFDDNVCCTLPRRLNSLVEDNRFNEKEHGETQVGPTGLSLTSDSGQRTRGYQRR